MAQVASCTASVKTYPFGRTLAGKRVRCKQCGTVFLVPATAESIAAEMDLSPFAEMGAETHAGGPAVQVHTNPELDEQGQPIPDLGKMIERPAWSEPVARAALRFDFPYA